MKTVGFSGGALVVELGPVNDMLLFFECLKIVLNQYKPERDFSLLSERLFKYYLCFNEINIANELMSEVYELFSKTRSRTIDWPVLDSEQSGSKLNRNLEWLSDVFSRYFSAFTECSESAEVMYDEFKSYPDYKYEPLRIVITSLPDYLNEQHRELELYDELTENDLPFWLR